MQRLVEHTWTQVPLLIAVKPEAHWVQAEMFVWEQVRQFATAQVKHVPDLANEEYGG